MKNLSRANDHQASVGGVVLAADSPVYLLGLRRLIVDRTPLIVLAETTELQKLEGLSRANNPQLLVYTDGKSERCSLDVLSNLLTTFPSQRIVFLYETPPIASRAVQSGVTGVFPKDGDPEELAVVLKKVAAGRRYVCERVLEFLPLKRNGNTRTVSSLSTRELQILNKISNGESLTQISRSLCIGLTTTSTYRSRILRKLGLRTNVDLMRYAASVGLVNLS